VDADEYRRMAALQESHWWFAAKRRMVTALLDRYHARPDSVEGPLPATILEVGCGTGAMLPVLRRWGIPVGADTHLPALRHVGGARRVAADVSRLPFRPDTFDLIGCFDVLYHRGIGDVPAALGELRRVCAPGGTLVVTDSAFPFLRSAHDVATHGARRFRLPGMRRMLEDAGFDVVHGTYFHKVLFPVAVAVRLTKRLIWGAPSQEADTGAGSVREGQGGTTAGDGGARPGERGPRGLAGSGTGRDPVPARSDLAPAPAWLNAVLGPLYRVETAVAARVRQPFGTSLAVVARRPEFR